MLSTPRLHLRLLGPEEAEAATRYLSRNREHFSGAGPRVEDDYFTVEYQQRRLARELELSDEGTLYRLWLYPLDLDEAGDPIGDISLSHIIRGPLHSCFVGYKIDLEHVGRGLMTEALERTVRFAFERLHLHRVEANIMPTNVASQRVAEKAGFAREGYSPKYLLINGRWEDHLRYAKLNDAWTGA